MSSWNAGRGSHRGGGRGGGAGRDRQRGRGTFAQHRQPRDSGYAPRAQRNADTGGPIQPLATNFSGSLNCDYVDPNPPSSSADPSTEPYRCPFRTHSSLALMLHKADRHLIYPEGGIAELKRHDPMLIAEQKEQQRRIRQQQRRAQPAASQPRGLNSKKGDPVDSDSDSDNSARDDDGQSDSDSGDDDRPVRPKDTQPKQDGRILDGPADATISGLNIQLDSPELIAEWINQRKKRWPTRDVVDQKLKEKQERQKRSEEIYGPRSLPHGKRGPALADAGHQDKRPRTEANAAANDNDGAVSNTQVAEGQEDDSDSDAAPEEVSSKAPDAASQEQAATNASSEAKGDDRVDRRPICTHFLQGRCSYGDRCKKRHETASGASASRTTEPDAAAKTQRRPHPRPAPSNPFDQPDLLRQLLRNEIEKHVDAVGQAIRFIVDNDMLLHVETEEGQAEQQRRRRAQIQVLPAEGAGQEAGASMDAEPSLAEPVVEGGLAVIKPTDGAGGRASLYRATSPPLRSLSELRYPPEADPLIYLDPLRRDDPKPLLPSQLVRIARDPVLRSVLTPSTPVQPNGHKPKALERAIVSLDALPSELYRNAAIEMILGIANASSGAAGPAGGLVVTSKDGRRKVSETDLFRMGLRVGGDEVLAIKKIADRLSVLLDSSLQLDEVGEQDWALLTKQQRDEMRRLHYDREADRIQRLRKLGIDV